MNFFDQNIVLKGANIKLPDRASSSPTRRSVSRRIRRYYLMRKTIHSKGQRPMSLLYTQSARYAAITVFSSKYHIASQVDWNLNRKVTKSLFFFTNRWRLPNPNLSIFQLGRILSYKSSMSIYVPPAPAQLIRNPIQGIIKY